MDAQMNSSLLTAQLSKRDGRALEESLSAFAHRFPVSGRIVHALAQEFGGVIPLAEIFEKNGMGEEAKAWLGDPKPAALRPEEVRNLFDSEVLDVVAQHLSIPRESVEIQAALGIPKFFASLGYNEEDFDTGFPLAKKKPGKGAKRGSHPTPP